MQSNWRNYIQKFNENDEELIIQAISNAEAQKWFEKEVPRFFCPDPVLEEIYYFRWWVFRKHIKNIGNSRIITEFLPAVPWSGPYNSINCACGHHTAEGRWLRKDKGLVKENLLFWLRGAGDEMSYSFWIGDTVYRYALVSGDIDFAIEVLPDLIRHYQAVERGHWTKYGLFWSFDDRDAMELSISGNGLRPTLNSYMYGNAVAISVIASWSENQKIQETFSKKAENLKRRMLDVLWDDENSFFKVIPQEHRNTPIESLKISDILPGKNVQEEIGYIPWEFGVAETKHDIAWKFLEDVHHFRAPCGITTAERCHSLFMNATSPHECQWNGPVWPFATTQTLNGMIRLLQTRESPWVNKEIFMRQMCTYANCHYLVRDNGKKVNWLDENLHPDTGEWLSRKILKENGWPPKKGGYERGKDYNHSAFCDLVIRGICGICPEAPGELTVNPLIPENFWDYFLLEDLPCQGHLISVGYDRYGTEYGCGKGLWVKIDGVLSASALTLTALHIQL